MQDVSSTIDLGLFITILISFIVGFLIGFLVLRSWAKKRSKKILDLEKESFIAIASHYLLTPLSIIEGAVATVQEHETTFTLEQRQNMHQKIKEGADRLLRIAEQMLLVVRLEQGELHLTKSIVALSDVIQLIIRRNDIAAKRKQVMIKLISDPDNKYEGAYDLKTITQAIEAVVDNAIKFSEENSQVVILLAEQNQQYIIEVRDQGIGLTAEQLQLAKDKFYRGTPPYQFDYEGIGLGLHVSDVIMRAHGGQILIFSDGKNRGTIVQLILPRS